MHALFRASRGPIVDYSERLASIAGIEQPTMLAFGRALVATVDAKWMNRFFDSNSDKDGYGPHEGFYPLLDQMGSMISSLVPSSCKIFLVCQTSVRPAAMIDSEDATALVGVPMAGVAIAFETRFLGEFSGEVDREDIASLRDIEEEDNARTDREEAALAIQQIIKRPAVLNSIKKWIWRP